MDTDQDMDNLSRYLRRVVHILLSGAAVSQGTEQLLTEELLTMIFWTDPRGPVILQRYQERSQ